MNTNISTRLLSGFGVLILITVLMVVLGVWSVTTLDDRLMQIVHSNYKDTMETVDIRETVNEVARAVYNLATSDDAESRRRDARRIEDSEDLIQRNFQSMRKSLVTHEGVQLVTKAQEAHVAYTPHARRFSKPRYVTTRRMCCRLFNKSCAPRKTVCSTR